MTPEHQLKDSYLDEATSNVSAGAAVRSLASGLASELPPCPFLARRNTYCMQAASTRELLINAYEMPDVNRRGRGCQDCKGRK